MGNVELEELEGYRRRIRELEEALAERDRREQWHRREVLHLSRAFRPAAIRAWYWAAESRLTTYLPAHGDVRDSRGLSAEAADYTEQRLLAIVHPEDRERTAGVWDRIHEDHEPYEIEYRLEGPDGQIRHQHEIGTPDFDEQDRYLGHFGTTQDITKRKQAEDALRKSEARYREIFEESPLGIWEDDWSEVKRMLDRLAAGGVTDMRAYFDRHREELMALYDAIKIVDISRATRELYGAPDTKSLIADTEAWKEPEEELAGHRDSMLAFLAGETSFEYEAPAYYEGREVRTARNRLVIPPQRRHDWSRVIFAIEDITERKQAEQALRDSEARYREIFEESPVGIWEDDWSEVKRMLDGLAARGVTDLRAYFDRHREELMALYDTIKVVGISCATRELYGAPDTETLIKDSRAETEPEEEIDGFRDTFLAFLAGETSFECEAPAYYEGREVGTTRTRLVIPPQRRHDWSRVISAIEDIAERNRAEDAVRKSEARYREIFEESPVGIWEDDWSEVKRMLDRLAARGVTDLRAYFDRHREELMALYDAIKVVGISRATRELLGAPDTRTLIKNTRAETEPEEELDGFRDSLVAFVAGTASFEYESPTNIARPPGRTARSRVVIPPQYRNDWSRVIFAIEDITERKRAEDALRKSEMEFRVVMDNSPTAIFLKDMEGRFRQVNRRFEEWYGRAGAEVLGKTSHDIFPPTYAEAYTAQDREVLDGMRVVERDHEIPFADGRVRQVRVTKFPVVDPDGVRVGVGTVNTDITEHKRAEDQLRQAQKMEAVGQLTGGIAHDFNNLLTIILGNAELALKAVRAEDPLREFLEATTDAARRGAELMGRLLAFSRRQTLRPQVLELNMLVGGMLGLVRRSLGETIEVDTVRSPDLWEINADPAQLEGALLNLAINARDALPDGGTLTIETGNTVLGDDVARLNADLEAGPFVMLAVSDTGTGIPPEIINHVFEPFFTTKEVG